MKKILLLAVIALVGTANAQVGSASDQRNEEMHKGTGKATEAGVGKEGCDECNKHRVHAGILTNTNPTSSSNSSSGSASGKSSAKEGAQ